MLFLLNAWIYTQNTQLFILFNKYYILLRKRAISFHKQFMLFRKFCCQNNPEHENKSATHANITE